MADPKAPSNEAVELVGVAAERAREILARRECWEICIRCFDVLQENDEGACTCNLRREKPARVVVVPLALLGEERERALIAEARAADSEARIRDAVDALVLKDL